MIVWVALGRLPAHTRSSIAQARLADPSALLVLLHEGIDERWRRFAGAARVALHDVGSLASDRRLRAFYDRPDDRAGFRGGFWLHSTGRFFVLRAFMEREGVEAVTHLENDVMSYAPEAALADWGPWRAPALSTVFENGTRAVPGVVRVGSRRSLDAFTDFVLATPGTTAADDMHRLAAFRHEAPALVGDLPTLPPADPGQPGQTSSLYSRDVPKIDLPAGGWLFDGARFGQYLGGIDPRNSRRILERWLAWQRGTLARPSGFRNESCVDAASQYEYCVTMPSGIAAPTLIAHGRRFPLATLHVHSKKLDRFASARLAGA